MRISTYKVLKTIFVLLVVINVNMSFSDNMTVNGVTIENLAVDTSGPNKFVKVLPEQFPQCEAVGRGVMLFNETSENAAAAYSTLLASFVAGKEVNIIHDGANYCRVLRVTILK